MNHFPLIHSLTIPAARLVGAIVTALSLVAAPATIASSIQGAVNNANGDPLPKVPICLKASSSRSQCVKLRSTDRRGNYQFNGLKPGNSYRVEILQNTSASGRKFEQYKSYVWEPQSQPAAIAAKNEALRLETIVGKFNFSNFQRVIRLTSDDFPELSSLDLLSDYLVLKVFLPAPDEGLPPETIFIGQVTSLEQILIEASVPLAAAAINYEIFSATLSMGGSIILSEN